VASNMPWILRVLALTIAFYVDITDLEQASLYRCINEPLPILDAWCIETRKHMVLAPATSAGSWQAQAASAGSAGRSHQPSGFPVQSAQ